MIKSLESSYFNSENEVYHSLLEKYVARTLPQTTVKLTSPPLDYVPNPAKVLIILEELGVPYQTSWVELEDLKKEPFTKVNPNGRVPGL